MTPITNSQLMPSLERMLKSAIVLSWDELMTDSTAGLIHVEYQSGETGSLDFLKIWASTIWGQWNLVCDFWARPLWSHAPGIRFAGSYHSVDLARALELVADKNGAFAGKPTLHGLIQVSLPTEVERSEARETIQAASEYSGSSLLGTHIAA